MELVEVERPDYSIDLVSEMPKNTAVSRCPFTSRTIVVTTLSGVAATLYRLRNPLSTWSESEEIKAEQLQLGKSRLVIIDEISFET
jgi:hypothetical protein